MRIESITGGIIKLRNNLQPPFKDNVSPMLFDYDFFSRLESFVKKEREKAKLKCIDYADKPSTQDGILIETATQTFELAVSKASPVFNPDKFVELISEKFDIPKHKLRELSTEAVVAGTPRKTYTVKQKGE